MEPLEQDPAARSGGTCSVVAFTAVMVLVATPVLSPLIVLLWRNNATLSDELRDLELRTDVPWISTSNSKVPE